jgi:ABC-2 type transport system permease protein
MAIGDSFKLYWLYVKLSVRAQLQYRAAFLLAALGQFLVTGIEFLGVWAFFDRFGRLHSWSLPEVAVFYGLVNCTFACADALSRGLDQFGTLYIKTGHFDRLLLRPRSTILQLAGHELALRRIGRFVQGLIVLVWAASRLNVEWSVGRMSLVLFTVLGGACLFFGLIVMQATLAFWTTETLEIMNTLTYGGVESAQYPMAIYHAAFRRFFTFVVPLACVSYFPVVGVLGITDPLGSPRWFQYLAPAFGVLFLSACLVLWKWGITHYTSTGS